MTFVEFLTGVRMEKAKELLMCSNLKTSEIGYEVDVYKRQGIPGGGPQRPQHLDAGQGASDV